MSVQAEGMFAECDNDTDNLNLDQEMKLTLNTAANKNKKKIPGGRVLFSASVSLHLAQPRGQPRRINI